MNYGIPIHCKELMKYCGKIKKLNHWYSQYECIKCGKIKNVKDEKTY